MTWEIANLTIFWSCSKLLYFLYSVSEFHYIYKFCIQRNDVPIYLHEERAVCNGGNLLRNTLTFHVILSTSTCFGIINAKVFRMRNPHSTSDQLRLFEFSESGEMRITCVPRRVFLWQLDIVKHAQNWNFKVILQIYNAVTQHGKIHITPLDCSYYDV